MITVNLEAGINIILEKERCGKVYIKEHSDIQAFGHKVGHYQFQYLGFDRAHNRHSIVSSNSINTQLITSLSDIPWPSIRGSGIYPETRTFYLDDTQLCIKALDL